MLHANEIYLFVCDLLHPAFFFTQPLSAVHPCVTTAARSERNVYCNPNAHKFTYVTILIYNQKTSHTLVPRCAPIARVCVYCVFAVHPNASEHQMRTQVFRQSHVEKRRIVNRKPNKKGCRSVCLYIGCSTLHSVPSVCTLHIHQTRKKHDPIFYDAKCCQKHSILTVFAFYCAVRWLCHRL